MDFPATAEKRILERNPRVGGSIPPLATTFTLFLGSQNNFGNTLCLLRNASAPWTGKERSPGRLAPGTQALMFMPRCGGI